MQQQLPPKLEYKYQKIKNGETLAYVEFNPQNTTTLILIHGNMTSLLWWYPLFQYLQKSDLRVIAVDLRGFGYSSENVRIEKMEDYSADLILFSEELNIQSAVYAGWSLGGCVVQSLAVQAPQIVHKLILVASGPTSGVPIHKYDPELKAYTMERCTSKQEILETPKIAYMSQLIKNRDIQSLMSLFKQVLFNGDKGAPNDEILKVLTEESLLQRNYEDSVWAIHNYNITAGGSDKAKDIKQKVLIYHGEKDVIVTKLSGQGIAIDIGTQKCQVIIKQGTGHSPPFDAEQDLSKQIIKFCLQLVQ